MRCVGCDSRLSDVEMSGTKQDGTQEDMCAVCRGIAFQWGDIDWSPDHEVVQWFLENAMGEENFRKYYLGVFNE